MTETRRNIPHVLAQTLRRALHALATAPADDATRRTDATEMIAAVADELDAIAAGDGLMGPVASRPTPRLHEDV